MSVKFKVRFTISGETVFALIAKMLPIEDLEVEEIPVKSLAERAIHKIAHKPKGKGSAGRMPMKLDSGINKVEDLEVEEVLVKSLAERAIAIHKIAHKPKGMPMKLDSGINKVILEALSSGPKRALELQIPIKAGGWSVSSVNSRLEFLRVRGIVVRVGDGMWRKAS